jgi:hypothetical protein
VLNFLDAKRGFIHACPFVEYRLGDRLALLYSMPTNLARRDPGTDEVHSETEARQILADGQQAGISADLPVPVAVQTVTNCSISLIAESVCALAVLRLSRNRHLLMCDRQGRQVG